MQLPTVQTAESTHAEEATHNKTSNKQTSTDTQTERHCHTTEKDSTRVHSHNTKGQEWTPAIKGLANTLVSTQACIPPLIPQQDGIDHLFQTQ